ncbi:MAG TPA: hypothetical protein VJ777_08290 [Mycobacterium sp.]|nr:hypothetical protein [Mycobacterium sp.]
MELAGRVLEFTGSVVGIAGIIITGYGLLVAWHDASGHRQEHLRRILTDLGDRANTRMTKHVDAHFTATGTLTATAVRGDLPVPEQVRDLFRQHLQQLPPPLSPDDVQAAIDDHQADQDAHVRQELRWALRGLGVSAVGAALAVAGIVADWVGAR